MPAFDWPLTIFTLITQVVLGAFAVLWVTDLLARQLAEPSEQEYLTRVGVWLLGPLMAVGFAVSTLHLGQPVYAFRALSNPQSSWLSREIIFLGGFFALGAVYAALWWRRRDQFTLRAAYGAVVGAIGGLGLLSMISLYLLSAMPTWDRLTTPLAFVASALVLGPLLVAAAFLATYRRHDAVERLEPLIAMHLRYMAVTVLVGAALAGLAVAITLATQPGLGLEGQAAQTLLVRDYIALFGGRVLLLVGGVALAVVLLRRLSRVESVRMTAPLVWALLGVFAVSELFGRLLFYATAVPVRPPGTFF